MSEKSSDKSTLIQNLSVRAKLLTGFGLVLLILLISSVLSYNALSSMNARFQVVTNVSETNLLISEARHQDKNFFIQKEPRFLQQAIEISTQARQLGEKSLEAFTHAESIALMREMLANIATYQQQLSLLSNTNQQTEQAQLQEIEQQMVTAALAADDAGTRSVANQLQILDQETNQLEWMIIIAAIIAIIIGVLAAIIITQMVVAPLQHVVRVAEKIASGDITEDLPTDRQDEPGQLMQAMQKMSISLRALINNLTAGIAQLATATEEMAAISEQNANGVNQQKQETEQVATAMNEMAATVQEVARSAEDASAAATESSAQADVGEQVVQKTIKQIKALAHEVTTSANSLGELKEQSNNIGSVLDVIKSIADQTNLLALNAAIEAARAGEAGRGFSVVAEEVRALAFRTQESTGQIEQLISTLQQKAEAAVSNMHKSSGLADNTLESADEAGEAIQAINSAVTSIQQMNQQIAAAALEQSTVAEEINRSIFSIRDVAEQSATASEETAAASNDLSRLGTELQQLARQFKVA
ncbi:MAG: methyl-accepting chemotaxis protein [Rheinheimera sp.]|uniref:methyl-accepting chemotaxis protein n=1 Tax=Arsukibacterium sp. UBA3155 TaxID=1946058 RepID=UPI000C983BDD|nr:methyl-accepting chemotaxis protein [Arsukibacterium sp. UBA3155]MAD75383.1 methyl-accepting chemotaxis protein [Rheinheimera sp.]|tara:strand:- start:208273 stop:209868 length:1596 start_codon:yes stop_codon:yes gene_type:complete